MMPIQKKIPRARADPLDTSRYILSKWLGAFPSSAEGETGAQDGSGKSASQPLQGGQSLGAAMSNYFLFGNLFYRLGRAGERIPCCRFYQARSVLPVSLRDTCHLL